MKYVLLFSASDKPTFSKLKNFKIPKLTLYFCFVFLLIKKRRDLVKYLSTIELPGIKLYQEKEVKMNFLLFNWDFSQKLWHWQNKTRKKLDERCFSNFLSFFMQEKNFNVTLEDVSRDMGMLSLQGPLSRRILQKLTPGNTDLSEEGFPFSTCQTLTVAGHQVHRLENRCLFPNIYNMKNQFWTGLGSRASTWKKSLGPIMSTL